MNSIPLILKTGINYFFFTLDDRLLTKREKTQVRLKSNDLEKGLFLFITLFLSATKTIKPLIVSNLTKVFIVLNITVPFLLHLTVPFLLHFLNNSTLDGSN